MRRPISIFIIVSCTLSCISAAAQNLEIAILRDSLDAVQLSVPSIGCSVHKMDGKWKVITIKTQEQWDRLGEILAFELKKGERNIEFRVKGKDIHFGQDNHVITNLKYPKTNIRISGKAARMFPVGVEFLTSHGKRLDKRL